MVNKRGGDDAVPAEEDFAQRRRLMLHVRASAESERYAMKIMLASNHRLLQKQREVCELGDAFREQCEVNKRLQTELNDQKQVISTLLDQICRKQLQERLADETKTISTLQQLCHKQDEVNKQLQTEFADQRQSMSALQEQPLARRSRALAELNRGSTKVQNTAEIRVGHCTSTPSPRIVPTVRRLSPADVAMHRGACRQNQCVGAPTCAGSCSLPLSALPHGRQFCMMLSSTLTPLQVS